MNYLFIGGCADGEVKRIDGDLQHVNVALPTRIEPVKDFGAAVAMEIKYNQETYKKFPIFRDHQVIVELYAPPDYDLSDIIMQLITNYRPQKTKIL